MPWDGLGRGIDCVEGDRMGPKGEVNAKVPTRELLGWRGGGLEEGDIRDRGLGGEEEENTLVLLRPWEEEVLPFPYHPRCLLCPLPHKRVR